MNRKTWIPIALGAVLAVSLAACGEEGGQPASAAGTPPAESTASTVEAVSGFTQYATMEEAAAVMGFAMTVPDAIDGYSYQEIQANPENGIFEVVFYTEYNTEEAEGRGQEIRFRKGIGTKDISGNYNSFAEINSVDVDGVSVEMRGAEGNVYLAVWIDGEYAYSIDSTAGMTQEAMSDQIRTVMAQGTPAVSDMVSSGI